MARSSSSSMMLLGLLGLVGLGALLAGREDTTPDPDAPPDVPQGPPPGPPQGVPNVQTGEAAGVAAIRSKFPYVSEVQALLIARVALAVRTRPLWLGELMDFESAHTFDPKKENVGCVARHGRGSGLCAVGLIQFMPSTCAWLLGMKPEGRTKKGTPIYTDAQKAAASARFAAMSFGEQMNYVRAYLAAQSRRTGGLDTRQKLAMAVFQPAAASWPLDREFSALIQQQNPGIRTPRDYLAKVYGPGVNFNEGVV